MSSNDITITLPPETAVEAVPSVHLVARDPEQMRGAQAGLRSWLAAKIAEQRHEAKELKDAYEIAKERKWGSSALQRHAALAKQRVIYYQKLLASVDSGFTLVPAFPMDVFAIRVNRRYSNLGTRWGGEGSNWAPSVDDDKAGTLPQGEGEYRSPEQRVENEKHNFKNDAGKDIVQWSATPRELLDVAFPLISARPEVMTAVAEAMSLKLFDEIGISPPGAIRARKAADPLLIGRIIAPKVGYTQRKINFLIAWHLDLRTL